MTIFSRITWPYRFLPPSKEPALKLRVGSAPTSSHQAVTTGRAVARPVFQAFSILAGFVECHAGLAIGLHICHRDGFRPVDDNRLDLLGTHHRTHAAASGLAAIIVVDAGIRDQVLAAQADDRDLELFAKFFLELLFHRKGGFAPQVGGIAQFDLIIINEKSRPALG